MDMTTRMLIQLAKDEADKRGGILVNQNADGKIFRGVPYYSGKKYSNTENVIALNDIRNSALKFKKSPESDEKAKEMRHSFKHLGKQSSFYDPTSRIPRPKARAAQLFDGEGETEEEDCSTSLSSP
jgi:hypothetical protein